MSGPNPDNPSGRRVSVARTMARGFRLRCPACGARTLFRSYLKLNPSCASCGADFSRSETADVAPYVTVFAMGLVATPLTAVLSMQFGEHADLVLAALLGGALVLTLVLLPRVKGMLAALLWRSRREM